MAQNTVLRGGLPAGLRRAGGAALAMLFPPRCIACGEAVGMDFGLCGACWAETHFLTGLTCDCCGAPLPGEAEGAVLCDVCLAHPRPWARGRAALGYSGTGRSMVLALKRADRLDLVRPMGAWLHRAASDLIGSETVIAPIPMHRLRLIRRRYNQAALLAREVARLSGQPCIADLFRRTRATPTQDHRSRAERFENIEGAIDITPRRAAAIRDRPVLIVDDVMTSGATLSAATEAALAAGALRVDVVTLARAAKDA